MLKVTVWGETFTSRNFPSFGRFTPDGMHECFPLPRFQVAPERKTSWISG